MKDGKGVAAVALATAAAFCLLAAAAVAGDPGSAAALTAGSKWRKYYVFAPPRVSLASAQANRLPTDDAARAKLLAAVYRQPFTSPPPATDWAAPQFDDADWQDTVGVDFTGQYAFLGGNPGATRSDMPFIRSVDRFVPGIAQIALRGKFEVRDPSKVKGAFLALTYRGGFVAYLNGREIARGGMPEGALGPLTPAQDYPFDAFCGKNNELIAHIDYEQRLYSYLKYKDRRADWAKRERTFARAAIDNTLLRKGVNVLAVELHRSDYPAEFGKKAAEWKHLPFATIGLSEIFLTLDCPVENVVTSNVRPSGLTLWNKETWLPVGSADFAHPLEALRPVRITAARNGRFSGQFIVGSTTPIDDLKVEYQTPRAGRPLPEAWVRLRYAAPNPTYNGGEFSWQDGLRSVRYDMLLDQPPRKVALAMSSEEDAWSRPVRECLGLPPQAVPGALVPVWISVAVPRNALPGSYEGALAVSANGDAPRKVLVQVEVGNYTLPDLSDWNTLVCLHESADTLAQYYQEDRWSDAHWKLIEESLRLMGDFGNAYPIFLLLAESNAGNAESLVRWIEQPGGGYKYDFALFDRYLDLVLKHYDRKRIHGVVLHVWGKNSTERFSAAQAGGGVFVTKLNPETGEMHKLLLPPFGTPECKRLMAPFLRAVVARLEKRGLAERIIIGFNSDVPPPPAHVAMFREILPQATWGRISHHVDNLLHYDEKDRTKSAPVSFQMIVFGDQYPTPTWTFNPDTVILQFHRAGNGGWNTMGYPDPLTFRFWMEHSVLGGRHGLGQIGADYFKLWPRRSEVNKYIFGSRGEDQGIETLYGCYPASAFGYMGLDSTVSDLFAPGPEGPVATVRSENAREGIQETEARIFLVKALAAAAAQLPEALSQRTRDVLAERIGLLAAQDLLEYAMPGGDVRARSRQLYDVAGEVQARLASVPQKAPEK